MKIHESDFGLGARLITLENSQGFSAAFTNLGARIVNLIVPAESGSRNIIWHFADAKEYLEIDSFPGATIGRFAGRISDGLGKIDGKSVKLDQNDGENTLHGGQDSFDRKLWFYEIIENKGDQVSVKFDLISNSGENGFPGQLKVSVIHSFDESGNWTIDYTATSSEDTIFNPTNHVYFNLTGSVLNAIDQHKLRINADKIAILNHQTLATGELLRLEESKINLNEARPLSEIFKSDEAQVNLVNGLDHPFFLKKPSLEEIQAELFYDDIKVSIFTDRPAIVLFTCNFDEAGLATYQGKLGFHGAMTFETQVAPGADKFDGFGSAILKAGEVFKSTTKYKIQVGEEDDKSN